MRNKCKAKHLLDYEQLPPRLTLRGLIMPLTRHWGRFQFLKRPWFISFVIVFVALWNVAVHKWPWLSYGSRPYWVMRCMRYRASPTKIVYEEESEAVSILLKQGAPYWWSTAPRNAIFCPREWRELAGYPEHYPAFLHERIARGGKPSLVFVEPQSRLRTAAEGQPRVGFEFRASSIDAEDRWLRFKSVTILTFPVAQNVMRVYAGQPDAADASHFTIKYEIDHAPGTIDGWLQGDDTVKLTIRDGPAFRSATTAPATQP